MLSVVPLLGLADESDLERQRRELAALEHQVAVSREELAARREERARLLRELEQSERDVASLARAGRQLAMDIAEQHGIVSRLQSRLDEERQMLAGERQALAELLRAAYAAGRADRLRLLLNQQDAGRLSRILAYYGYINRQRLQRLDAIQAQAEATLRLAEQADEEAKRLQQLADYQRQTQERLEVAQERRGQVLAKLEQRIASRDEEVAGLEADAAAMRRLIERLEQIGGIMAEVDVRPERLSEHRGRLPWPIAGGNLLVRFGTARETSRLTWDGVVLAAPEGTPVRAVHAGRIIYADWLRGFGLLLIIDHDGGYMTLYGNNQALLKDPGEWVMSGEPVALSGTTGGRSVSGLYFAVRKDGKPMDPETWCSADARFDD